MAERQEERITIPAQDSTKSPDVGVSQRPTTIKSPSAASANIIGRTSPLRAGSPSYKEREQRVRLAREQQEQERSRRLDELKQATLVQHNYRLQADDDRKRKVEEVRLKDNCRQQAVLERKKQIVDAEMERREALLMRKKDREAKLEAKKNQQRNSMSFAFRSNTPRLYETYDIKSAQSTANLAATTPTGKRSVSLNRNSNGDLMTKSCTSLSASTPSPAVFGRGRRKTDLRPTMPRDKDTPSTPRSAGGSQMRTAISMSRLDQLAQPRRRRLLPSTPPINKTVSPSAKSISKSMSNIAFGQLVVRSRSRTPLGPPPIKKTVPDHSYSSNPIKKSTSMVHLSSTPRPTKASKMRADVRVTLRKPTTDPRPKSSMSEHSLASSQASAATAPVRKRSSTPHKPRPLSMTTSVIIDNKPRPSRSVDKKASSPRAKSATSTDRKSPQVVPVQAKTPKTKPVSAQKKNDTNETPKMKSKSPSPQPVMSVKPDIVPDDDVKEVQTSGVLTPSSENGEANGKSTKPRITSEEEAKAALAERRRQAREKAEKEAEEERLKQEKQRLEEEERRRKEEEEERLAEEHAQKLAEEYRQNEEKKLLEAIEQRKREEDEARKVQEEEAKLKAQREKEEQIMREKQEEMLKEKEEEAKIEEQRRAERRKHVASIMSRIHKGSPASEQNKSSTDTSYMNSKNSEDTREKIQQKLDASEQDTEKGESNAPDVILTQNNSAPSGGGGEVAVQEGTSQPSSIESTSSDNTVIFNGGGGGFSDYSQSDSVGSSEQNGHDVAQTNGLHISNSGQVKSSDSTNTFSLDSLSRSASLTDDSGVTMSPENGQDANQLIDLSIAPPTTIDNRNEFDNNPFFNQDLNSNVNSTTTNPLIAFDNNPTAHLSHKHEPSPVADLLG